MNPDLFKVPTSAVGPQGEPIFDIFQGGQKLSEQQFAGLGQNVADIPIGNAPVGFTSAFPTAEIKIDTNNPVPNDALEAQKTRADLQKLITENIANRSRLTEESISALRPSAREQELQQQLIGLNRNEAESITRLGNQPILSAIAQGQQSQVQRLAAIERTALAQELGLQQANRQFLFDSLKLRLEQAGVDEASLIKLDEINREMEQDAIAKEDRLTEQQSTLLNNLVSNYIGLSLTDLDPASKTQVANAARALGIPLDAIANRLQVEKNKLELDNAKARADIAATNRSNTILGGGVIPGVSGPLNEALNTILGSGKFTAQQAQAVRNAIANGEDPATVIRNQAKSLLGATASGDLGKYEVAKAAMNDLDALLKQYYANGGKTSIFSGNYEKTLNKLGSVSDPKLVDIATQIQAQLQVYRNAVSGTAYSEQEGKDIASIFPGINKSEGLNKAIISGRLAAFDSVIDNTYRNILGSAYDSIKVVSPAGSSTTGTTPPSPADDFVNQIIGKVTAEPTATEEKTENKNGIFGRFLNWVTK